MTAASNRGDKLIETWSELGVEPERLDRNRKGTLDPPLPEGQPPMAELTAGLPPLDSRGWSGEIQRTELLAEGGHAIVSIATQASLARQVVVKELKPDDASSGAARALLQEGYVLGALQHPNVVPAHLIARDEHGQPVLVLKRVEGTSWRCYVGDGEPLDAPDESADPLVWNLQILMQVCHALSYAHREGILHRDLKPENVMIGEFGEVYLMDWGLAVSVQDESAAIPHARQVRSVVGTPEYMAPEMALGDGASISERTDVYLLGACLHELLTGWPPNDAESIAESLRKAFTSRAHDYDADAPAELVAICRKAMSVEPEDRYDSAEQVRLAIAEFLQHRGSGELCAQAEQRARRLEELLAEGAAADPVAVARLFGECRFGFRQALRGWSGNPRARAGQRQLLERLARHELDRDAPEAAAMLLAELEDPDPALADELEAMRRRLGDEQRRLQRIEHHADLEQGKRERRRLMTVICGLFGLTFFVFGALDRMGLFQARWGSMLALNMAYGGALLWGLSRWREALGNQANRRFVGTLLMSFAGPALLWSVAWWTTMDFALTLALTSLLYFVVGVSLTLATHVRLLWAAAPFAPAYALASLQPRWAYESLGAAMILAVLLLVGLWRQLGSYNAEPTATDAE